MNMPSPYQGDFFRELATRPGLNLNVVFAQAMDPQRCNLGWEAGPEGFGSQTLPRAGGALAAVRLAWQRRGQVHVINGVWSVRSFFVAAIVLLMVGTPVFFHGEASDPRLPRSRPRVWLRDLLGRLMLRRAKGVFAISSLAEHFYGQLGANLRTLFPFGYFKKHPVTPCPLRDDGLGGEIIFVGQLIARKNIDGLLHAFEVIAQQYPEVRLTIVGAGPEAGALRSAADASGFGSRVVLTGAVSSREIDQRIARASVLVLPSAFDGWGLVVNEAVAMGVPVVVSDACGVADLVGGAPDGLVFPAGNVPALTAALRRILTDPGAFRPDAESWRRRLGVETIADYFLSCLNFGLNQAAVAAAPGWRIARRPVKSPIPPC